MWIHVSIYKQHSTAPVVNKEECLYWTVGTWPRVGTVLAQYSPSPETAPVLIDNFRPSYMSEPRRWQAVLVPALCQYLASAANISAVLTQQSLSPQTKCRLTTEFRVMPILNQYRLQCWHVIDVQYRASTDGQLPTTLPFGAAPVVGRAYASTAPVLRQSCKFFCGTGAVPSRL